MLRILGAGLRALLFTGLFLSLFPRVSAGAEVVSFPSGKLTLQGTLYKPEGPGPFPAVVYNHGSAAGMLSEQAFEALGPVFASHGWVFFGPYRRGQGRSAAAGPYIGDEIAAAIKKGGTPAGAATMVRLLETDHLDDQLAALTWLRAQKFVEPHRIAVAGTSFGGIEVVLGAERAFFEHLRGRAPPPRHGLLFLHPAIQSAPRGERGKLARALAGKVSIAARLDVAGAPIHPELAQAFDARRSVLKARRGATRRPARPRRSVLPLDGAARDR